MSTIVRFLVCIFLFPVSVIAQSSLPSERTIGHIEPVFKFLDSMPAGVTVSRQGRIFVNFPRWGDHVPFTVAEIRDGKLIPFPNANINRADESRPSDTLISVQSVVVDAKDRLWILDTASPSFRPPISGGAKLIAIDLVTNQVVKTIVFPPSAVLPTTYVNDVRFDLRIGKEGVAYVTDSSLHGPGAILVVDLSSGKVLRRLSGHSSTSPDKTFVPMVEGETWILRKLNHAPVPLTVAADGIALSADGATLYYCPLSSRHLYSIPTAALRDDSISEKELGNKVVDLGEKGASD
ncbi:MAG: gluconolaconase, partial [Verrucomicrobia bacterium]